MKLEHVGDGGTVRALGVTSSPGDEIEVDRETGRRLEQYGHLELAEPDETCTEPVDGFVCGREEPCQYHTEGDE